MAKSITSEITTLEGRLKKLKAQELADLRRELRDARKRVTALKLRIATITGKVEPGSRRKRITDDEKLSRVSDILSKTRKGLSQMEISRQTDIPYPSLAVFLKAHQKEFKTTGKRKQKRYFLK